MKVNSKAEPAVSKSIKSINKVPEQSDQITQKNIVNPASHNQPNQNLKKTSRKQRGWCDLLVYDEIPLFQQQALMCT